MRLTLRLVFVCLIASVLRPQTAAALTITAVYDTSITNHPQAATIQATINAAIAQYQAKITDPIAVTIVFVRSYTGLAGSSSVLGKVTYSQFISALRNHAASTDDGTALGHLPDGPTNPVTPNDSILARVTVLRAFGLASSPSEPDAPLALSVMQGDPGDRRTTFDPQAMRGELLRLARVGQAAVTSPQAAPDGTVNFNLGTMNLSTNPTPAGQYSLFAAARHEIDEVLGSGSVLNNLSNGAAVPTGPAQPEDLFRYNKFGNRSLTTSATDSSYLSLDGTTRLVRFNQTQGGDFSDWYSPAPVPSPHVQDAFGTQGVDPAMDVEWQMLDAIGWSQGPIGVWVDFAYGGFQNGAYVTPYSTLGQGAAAVADGSTVFLKGNRSSGELLTITRPMTLASVGGVVTIGP